MPLSSVQKGAIGQFAFLATAMITGNGQVEAYTPAAKRKLGYYALPLLWRDEVVGWANAALVGGALEVETGFTAKRPREAAFRRELDAEIQRMSTFLGTRVGKIVAR